jgi:hypothetical protein
MKRTFNKGICILICTLAFCSCVNLEFPKPSAIDKITITGKVVDENDVPIINCRIELDKSYFMSPSIPFYKTYTNEQGEFEIEFSPEKLNSSDDYWSYQIDFYKDGYRGERYYVDLHKAHQIFNITMMRDTPPL